MSWKIIVATAALLATAGAAAAPDKGGSAAKVIQSCDAHKFETVVTATVDGQPRQSKVKLCGVEGQTEAAWIKTLRDATRKIDADTQMDPAVRTQIKTAIDAEIARLTITSAVPGAQGVAVSAAPSATALPPPRRSADSPIAQDFAALPPLPTEPPPPPHLLGSETNGPAIAAAETGTPHTVRPSLAAGPAPKLSLACHAPGDLGGEAPCAEFEQETMLTVRADDRIAAGAALRFVRNGQDRAEVDLAALAKGQSQRVALPREVCAGFGAGRLEVQLVQNGSVVRSDGPYPLRCY